MSDGAALRRRLLWTAAAGIALYFGLAVYADYNELRGNLSAFSWEVFPVVLLLTLGNYAGRLVKWRWYLALVDAGVGWRPATKIFGVAMTMVLTPGKAGELVKSYMVKNVSGTPMRVTAPIVLAERLTDGMAMLILASAGLYSFRHQDPRLLNIALLVLGAMATVIVFVQVRPLALWALRVGERVPVVRKGLSGITDFYESSYVLLRPRNLAIAVAIGVVSWSMEGLAYYLVLRGVGGADAAGPPLTSIFIFSISSIMGAVVPTPGGLGATETLLIALPVRLLQFTRSQAVTAAILVRIATLWFGVAIGLVAFARWSRLMEPSDRTERTSS